MPKRLIVLIIIIVAILGGVIPHPQQITNADSTTIDHIRTYTKGTIETMVWSPDGQMLAVGGGQGIWLYNNGVDEEPVLLDRHRLSVTALAFHPNGKYLVSGGEDNMVLIWDVNTFNVVDSGPLPIYPVRSLLFTSDGQTLFAGSDDGVIYVFDFDKGYSTTFLIGHQLPVTDMTLNADETLLIASAGRRNQSPAGEILIWDLSTETFDQVFETDEFIITDIHLSGTENKLYVRSGDKFSPSEFGPIRIFDLDTQSVEDEIFAENFAHLDEDLYVFSNQTNVCIQNGIDGQIKAELEVTQTVDEIAYSPATSSVAIAGEELLVWSLSDNNVQLIDYYPDRILTIDAYNDQYIAASNLEGRVYIWNQTTGDLLATRLMEPVFRQEILFAPGGENLIIASNGTFQVWDWQNDEIIAVQDRIEFPIMSMEIIHDDATLLVADFDHLNHISLEDWSILEREYHEESRYETIVVPSRGWLLRPFDQTIQFFDSSSLELLGALVVSFTSSQHQYISDDETLRNLDLPYGGRIDELSLNSSGNLLASSIVGGFESPGVLHQILIWDLNALGGLHSEIVIAIDSPNSINELSFLLNSDSLLLVAVERPYQNIAELSLWDIEIGTVMTTVTAHLDEITEMVFVEDTQRFFTSSEDGTVKLWEIQTD